MRLTCDSIDLDVIYDSGQCFRWDKHDGGYVIVAGSSVAFFRQVNETQIEAVWTVGDPYDWYGYFDMPTDYSGAKKAILREHPELHEALAYGKGMRLLVQDPFEMIITFILSANNNIPRIKSFIKQLSNACGDPIETPVGVVYTFPSLEKMKAIDEATYKKWGAGYRANYLVETVKVLNSQTNIDVMTSLGHDELIRALQALKGVGFKVASCIALYGFGHKAFFPIDTWIKKALARYYDVGEMNQRQLEQFVETHFKVHPGLVQQYLFYDERGRA